MAVLKVLVDNKVVYTSAIPSKKRHEAAVKSWATRRANQEREKWHQAGIKSWHTRRKNQGVI
jgi:hypothetical protein